MKHIKEKQTVRVGGLRLSLITDKGIHEKAILESDSFFCSFDILWVGSDFINKKYR